MISLYAGRLLLVCSRADRTWYARVVLGPRAEHQLEADTGTVQLQEALLRAQSIFRAAVVKLRPEPNRMCWDCLQWDMRQQRCVLALPEAKRSGGRYAPRCEMFEPAIRSAD